MRTMGGRRFLLPLLSALVEGGVGGRPVIWDAKGVRYIVAELLGAGVDLKGVMPFYAMGAWVGTKITVLGTGVLPTGEQRVWVARLPIRP